MPTSSEMREAKMRAERVIRDSWRSISRSYTIGWGGPIDAVEERFSGLRDAILDIRSQISAELPITIFQRRVDPESDTVFVVPFWKDSGNPFNSRVVSTGEISDGTRNQLGMFAQSFWFAIDAKLLPPPGSDGALEKALRRWTGREFFE